MATVEDRKVVLDECIELWNGKWNSLQALGVRIAHISEIKDEQKQIAAFYPVYQKVLHDKLDDVAELLDEVESDDPDMKSIDVFIKTSKPFIS